MNEQTVQLFKAVEYNEGEGGLVILCYLVEILCELLNGDK